MRISRSTLLGVPGLLVLALVAASCGGNDEVAHEEDHPHGPDGEHLPATAAASVSARQGGMATVHTDSTELYLQHPALVVGELGRFAVHLTDATDFKPLTAGTVTFRFVPRDGGTPIVVTQDAPREPGIYGPVPDFARPGAYDLTVLVDSPQARDSITVPGLQVYARAADAPPGAAPDTTGIAFLKAQQWATAGFRITPAVAGTVAGASGVVIPTSAILTEDAKRVAYMQLSGEHFEKRELTLGGAEGGRTLVLSGLQAGEYVVSGGAAQLRRETLSPAARAHGHEH